MEEVYSVESYPHVSERVNLHDYFSDFSKCLSDTVLNLQSGEGESTLGEKIGKAMGIPLDEVEQLQNNLDVSLLQLAPAECSSPIKRSGRKKKGMPDPEKVLLDRATRTLATAVELKAAKSRPLKNTARLKEIVYLAVPEFEKAHESDITENESSNNLILIARIFRPLPGHMSTIPRFLHYPRTINHEQDIMLHGSLTLDKFRDKITCINDDVVVGNNEGEAEGSQVPMKKLITSGMFFFGETFYCDFRDTLNQDYGRVIDEWSKANPEMRIGPFKHAAMESTLVSDLNIRLGFPYVYMHLGNCEHIITFLDAMLMSPTDVQDIQRYPLVVNAENKIVYCHACDTYSRAWVVEDDKLPTKPAYLCKQCYHYFYTRKGERVNPPFSCKVPGALDTPHAGLT